MISCKINNISGLKKVSNNLNEIDQKLFVQKMQTALAIRQAVEMEMANVLGDDIKHFTFSVNNNGLGFSVSVGFADEVGKYIYYGTQPHNITSSSNSMPIGGGKFASSVRHPGTKGKKSEIDGAIRRGIMEGRMAAGRIGSVL